jgi:aquaporin TIP
MRVGKGKGRADVARRQQHQHDELEPVRQGVVEFIGAFALMFIGGGAIIMTAGENLVAIALAHGIAIGVMVAAAGHISGGLYNPALVVGLVATGRMPLNRGILYIISELAGAVVAALALKAIYDTSQVDAVSLGTPLVGARYEVSAALLAEIIMTFFLMYVVYGTAVDKLGAKAIAPLAIGLTITIDVFAGGAVSGAAMNPSRAFGPALVQGVWDDHWIYWVGPIAGALLAAFLYNTLLIRGDITPDAGHVEVEPTTAQREARVATRRRKR